MAGANGVGKSNLFDAIYFLSALADKSLLEAALAVAMKQVRRRISVIYFIMWGVCMMMRCFLKWNPSRLYPGYVRLTARYYN